MDQFIYQNGNINDSVLVVGRNRNTDFPSNENDSGTIFYAYSNALSLIEDSNNFYMRTNSLPNYKPKYSKKIIEGTWSDELGDSDDYDYSIASQNFGWIRCEF